VERRWVAWRRREAAAWMSRERRWNVERRRAVVRDLRVRMKWSIGRRREGGRGMFSTRSIDDCHSPLSSRARRERVLVR